MPQIIFLTGASSAGKISLIDALKQDSTNNSAVFCILMVSAFQAKPN